MRRDLPFRAAAVALALAAATAALVAQPDSRPHPALPPGGPQHLDARVALARGVKAAPAAAQRAALASLREALPDLRAEIDDATGATTLLWNTSGYLTAPDARDAGEVAEDFMRSRADLLGLAAPDVVDHELVDRVPSAVSGVTHLYYRQRVNGIPVYNAQLHFNITADGRILSVNNQFLPNVTAAVASLRPQLDAVAAVGRAAAQLGLRDVPARLVRAGAGPRRATRMEAPDLSSEEIAAALVIVPVRRGMARLAWNFQVRLPDGAHAFDYTVDAESGQVWTRFDWVSADTYRVYALPTESPGHASPASPADGRSLVVDPAHPAASPYGWHDTNGIAGAEFLTTEGNNVHAYADANDDNVPDTGSSPSCGVTIECDFPLDLASAPSAYQAAAVTNLFYWNNVVHDVQQRYGFTPAAGNFQVHNYGQGGLGNDSVRAEAQDGYALSSDAHRNNANFLTPPDGQRPRMQMYVWTTITPLRDGDFDAGIVVHEYGHGISNRLVGGPSNVSCLTNAQQPGEGISDWLALVYTARAGDTPAMGRGIGTYAMGQPPTGQGIRAQRYSTDPAVNNWTYESVAGAAVPHGVGAVWAQAMWEVYWALVAQHGWSADLYDATGGAGNQRAMLYHNEGLMNAACSPSFTQVRDGIIQAAQTINGGADVCRLWDAFAAFGLGVDAQSGGKDGLAPLNGFSTPLSCGGTPPPGVSIADTWVTEGDSGTVNATFTVSLTAPAAHPVTVAYRTSPGSAASGITTGSVVSAQVLSIPDAGPASSYPSTVSVPQGAGRVQSVAVTLNGFTHPRPDDVDVLLVGPDGQRAVLLMSDVGGAPATNVSLTFRDDAGGGVPAGPIPSGAYLPSNSGGGDVFPGAPPAPYGSALSDFVGTDAPGLWQLFIVDDQAGSSGALTGGWTLHLGTAGNDFVPRQGTVTFPPGSTTQAVTVPVLGDVEVEGDESFTVTLSSAGGAYIADEVGTATIVDDDVVGTPDAPSGLFVSSIVGNTVSLGWTPPAGGLTPTGYVIEGGISPGEVAASIPTGSTLPLHTFGAPSGVFYVRVHALVGGARSVASNEIRIHVNVPVPPSPPANLLSVVDGASLTLTWTNTFGGGAPAALMLDVSGDIDTTVPLGLTDTFSFAGVPPGTYTLGLRAVNAAGSSPAAGPLILTFPGTCAGPPDAVTNLRAYRLASIVYVAWEAPATGVAPTSYVLRVTGPFSGAFGTTARAMSGVVGSGTYELSVVAANACGIGPPSGSQTVVVP